MLYLPRFRWLWGLIFSGLAFAVCAASESAPRILVLSSWPLRQSWTADFLKNMQDAVRQKHPEAIIDPVALDASLLRNEGYEDRFNLCLPQIRAGKYFAVVAVLDKAVGLTLRSCGQLPSDLPVLLAGVRSIPPDMKRQYPNVSGVVTGCGAWPTLRVGLLLNPDASEGVFISDDPRHARSCSEHISTRSAEYPSVSIRFMGGRDFSERQVLDQLAMLPRNTLVIWNPKITSCFRSTLSPEAFGERIFQVLHRPYLVMDDALLGHGALGGYVMSSATQGRQTGLLLCRLLDGEPVSKIDFIHCMPELVIDRGLAEKFGIALNRLPPGTHFRQAPLAFLANGKNRLILAGCGLLMLALCAIIIRNYLTQRKNKPNTPSSHHQKLQSWRDFPHADGQAVERAISEILDNGAVRHAPFDFGKYHRIAALLRMDPTVFGKDGLVGISYDVSGQPDVIRRRRLLARHTGAALRKVEDGLMVFDAAGRVVFMNIAAERLIGCSAAIARGRYWSELAPVAENQAEMIAWIEDILRTGAAEVPVRCAEWTLPGEKRQLVGCAGAPIRDGDKGIGAVLLLRTIEAAGSTREDLFLGLEKIKTGEFSFFRYRPHSGIAMPIGAAAFRFRPLADDGTPVSLDEWFTADTIARIRQQIKKIYSGESHSFFCPVETAFHAVPRHYQISVRLPSGVTPPCDSRTEVYGIMQDMTECMEQPQLYRRNLALQRLVFELLPAAFFSQELADAFRYLLRSCAAGGDGYAEDGEWAQMKEDNRNAILAAGMEMIEFTEQYREPETGRYGSGVFVRLVSLSSGVQLLLGVCVGVSLEKLAIRSESDVLPVLRRVLQYLPQDVMVLGVDNALLLQFGRRSYSGQTGDFRWESDAGDENGTTAPAGNLVTPDAVERARRNARGKFYQQNRKSLNESMNSVAIAEQFETSVRGLLAELGSAADADHAFAYRYTEHGIQQRFEWIRAAGNAQESMVLDSISSRLRDYFSDHDLLRIEDVHDANSPLADCVPLLAGANIGALMLHRVLYEGRLFGFVGVTTWRRSARFGSAETAATRVAAAHFRQARQRRDQMENLAESARRRHLIFGRLEQPAVLYDKELRIAEINQKCLQLFDVEPEVIGNFCGALYCGAENAECCSVRVCPVWKSMETLIPQRLTYNKEGRMLLRQTLPLFDMDGQLLSILECVADYPGDEQAQRELEAAQQRELAMYARELRLYISQDHAINRCMEILAQDTGLYDALQQLTAKIGHELSLDNCTLFHLLNEQDGILVCCANWHAPGTVSRQIPAIPHSTAPNFFRALEMDGEVAFHWQAEAPERMSPPWAEELRRYHGDHAYWDGCCGAVFRNGQLWGFLGGVIFDACRLLGNIGERTISIAARVVELLLAQEAARMERLYAERDRQKLLNLMPTPILLLGRDLNIECANTAAAAVLGVPHEIISSIRYERHCPICSSAADCLVELTMTTGDRCGGERMIGGKPYRVHTQACNDGERCMVCLIPVGDPTAQTTQLRKSFEKAMEAARAKSFFLAALNRNLQLSVNVTDAFAQQEESLPETEDALATGLLQLLERLMELSRQEAEEVRLSPHETDFNSILEEVQAMIRPQAQARGLRFQLSKPETPPLLMLDDRRIRQVLQRLLNHVMTLSADGVLELSWQFDRVDAEYGILTILLDAEGYGRAENQATDPVLLQDIVERGWERQSLVALELTVAMQLVECMEGALMVERQERGGCRFRVTLPEVHYREEETLAVAATPERVDSVRVLLVDDISLNLRLASELLRKFRGCCRCAASGTDALAQLAYFQPDWLFCDDRMPGMDGPAVAEAIRANPAWNAIRLALMTTEGENVDAGLFDAVLHKPLNADAVADLLRRQENTVRISSL